MQKEIAASLTAEENAKKTTQTNQITQKGQRPLSARWWPMVMVPGSLTSVQNNVLRLQETAGLCSGFPI